MPPDPEPRTKRWLLFAILALSVGCSEAADTTEELAAPPPSSAGAPAGAPERRAGSLSFSLTTRDGSFTSFSYAVTGPSFSKSGSIPVSNSNRISALVEGIPVGAGYTITLSGRSVSSEPMICSGSADFEIEAGAVTNAVVPVSCHFTQEPAEPSPPTAAPLPPFSPVLLGATLLALGVGNARRRRRVEHD